SRAPVPCPQDKRDAEHALGAGGAARDRIRLRLQRLPDPRPPLRLPGGSGRAREDPGGEGGHRRVPAAHGPVRSAPGARTGGRLSPAAPLVGLAPGHAIPRVARRAARGERASLGDRSGAAHRRLLAPFQVDALRPARKDRRDPAPRAPQRTVRAPGHAARGARDPLPPQRKRNPMSFAELLLLASALLATAGAATSRFRPSPRSRWWSRSSGTRRSGAPCSAWAEAPSS